MRGSSLQQNRGRLQLALPSGDVQGGVAVGGGGVRVGHVLEQQLDDLRLAQARRDVEGSLVLLGGGGGKVKTSTPFYWTMSSYRLEWVLRTLE